MDWQEKVVVITGGSAGVGLATARAFAKRGARLALLARDEQRLGEAVRLIRDSGGEARAFPVDVANAESVRAAAAAIETEMGPIEVWVNNATVTVVGTVDQIGDDEFKRVMEVTYLGYVHGTRAALRHMRGRDRGRIVQISSGLAFRAIPLQSAYCAAKHAIRGFTESLRVELMHQRSGIAVTMVHLPAVNTPQFSWTKSAGGEGFRPMGPVYRPDFVAEQIVWAAGRDRREVFIGGMTLLGRWINAVAPGLADRYLARNAFRTQIRAGAGARRAEGNLWRPVNAPALAAGEFGIEARAFSLQVWITRHRALSLAALAVAGLFFWRRPARVERT